MKYTKKDFENNWLRTDRRTDGLTDRPTDGQTLLQRWEDASKNHVIELHNDLNDSNAMSSYRQMEK